MLTSSKPLKDIFCCPEESSFYSHCLETLVLNHCSSSEVVIEFGSGDGEPVINSLIRTKFAGFIHGFELNTSACKVATSKIKDHNLSEKYVIHNTSFFNYSKPEANYLISNPPYLPAADDNIYQPSLYGGIDGSSVSKALLSLNYENVLLMISSYSNPEGLINYAATAGYSIPNFIVAPLNFGFYSSEPKVKNRIAELRTNNMAFYSKNIYLLAGVLFTKHHESLLDLSTEFSQIMTAL